MTHPIVKKAAIEVKGVVKTFKSKKAVDGVDFTIQAGTVTALLEGTLELAPRPGCGTSLSVRIPLVVREQ